MTLTAYFHWLKRDWAKAGLFISIFLFVFLFAFVKATDFVLFLLLLQTPLYMLHETEEYIFPGGFGKFFNIDILKLETEDKPVDENFVFYVNVILVWIILPIFGLLAANNYQYGLWIPYFSFFAGVAHIALGIKARKPYNPGLLISLLLNIPVGTWSILYLVDHGILPNIFLNPHLVIGLGVNLVLPAMGVVLYKKHLRTITA
ncbi:MAG: HXXEE domain-containing protein [Planctomycetes bacterium]|nr:HXXEE domain-containing protein [Planctomycetota bacterium]